MFRILAVGTALALAACNSSTEPEEAPKEAPSAEEAADIEQFQNSVEQVTTAKEFQDSVEAAMSDIPPEHREEFQVAFNCEIERNQELAEPKPIDASTIRRITADLKAGKDLSC